MGGDQIVLPIRREALGDDLPLVPPQERAEVKRLKSEGKTIRGASGPLHPTRLTMNRALPAPGTTPLLAA